MVEPEVMANAPAASATLRSAEANAAARQSYFANRAAAMQAQQEAQQKSDAAYMASEQDRLLGRRQGFPWPLSALFAAVQGVLQRIKAALFVVPAFATAMRLKALKQVIYCGHMGYPASAPA